MMTKMLDVINHGPQIIPHELMISKISHLGEKSRISSSSLHSFYDLTIRITMTSKNDDVQCSFCKDALDDYDEEFPSHDDVAPLFVVPLMSLMRIKGLFTLLKWFCFDFYLRRLFSRDPEKNSFLSFRLIPFRVFFS